MADIVAQDDHQWLLIENHCPIGAAVSGCQHICRSELEAFRYSLEAKVVRSEYIINGSRRCAYLVS